ncbi:MAG: hypothetical protein M3Q45_05280 [Chloroflexota bacterium]|nr:hypothetical protein [Chloroflexota bacterium]
MSDGFVENAQANMGAVERLLKGLPGIRGYMDKELRRDADKRVRMALASELDQQKQALLGVQNKLLKGGGLTWLDDVDAVVQKLQTLVDRVKTASYGYTGLFDAVKIGEEQLAALHQFDLSLAGRVGEVENAVQGLSTAVAGKADLQTPVDQLMTKVTELDTLFSQRNQSLLDPALLTNPPPVTSIEANSAAMAELSINTTPEPKL